MKAHTFTFFIVVSPSILTRSLSDMMQSNEQALHFAGIYLFFCKTFIEYNKNINTSTVLLNETSKGVSFLFLLNVISLSGSWPVASDPFQLEACEMEIVKPCRHHILNLGCRSTAASLSSVPLPFPGQFVQLQYVVALVNNNSKELIDCRMFSFGNRQFKIINVSHSCCDVW